MRKIKGSGNYLKNQVRINLAKAALCLLLFFLLLFFIGWGLLFIKASNPIDLATFLVSLVPLGAFYYYLRRYRVYSGGWTGEKQVTKLLGSKLSDDYLLLNDLRLRSGGGDIDHIVLGPNGIFVLETKNWSGDVTCHGDMWQRAGKPNFKGSPSLQVKRNAARVKQAVDASPSLSALGIWVEGIVVFTNRHATLHLNNPTVTVVRLPQLPSHITSQRSAYTFSRQQLETLGKEILKQKA